MSDHVGDGWLRKRVRVFAGYDWRKEHLPMVEGVVIAYAPAPTITVRTDEGRQSDWMVTLPIDVLGEDQPIPDVKRPTAAPAGWDEADYQRDAADAMAAIRDTLAARTAGWRDRLVAALVQYGVGRSTAPRLADALLPVVADIVAEEIERSWLRIREAHDWQCDCSPDDPCRIRTALMAARAAAVREPAR